jgi:regulator of sigma E protease
MQVLTFVWILFLVLLLFNLLIFVHELGHFLAARWRGLKVERFAIWFGKPIWKKEVNGVEFALGCIPAGGYVSLPQMAPMELIEGKGAQPREELPPISALDKIIVAFAGPLFSFLLAVAFAFVVWGIGRPVNESEATTVIGYVDPDGPAAAAGLKPGDRILEVDGKRVSKFGGMGDSVVWRVVRSEGKTVPVKVQREGQVLVLHPEPKKEKTSRWQRQGLRQILIEPAQSSIIGRVETNSPALLAGLKPGDEIIELNGRKPLHYAEVSQFIEQHGTEPLTFRVQRQAEIFAVTVRPEFPLQPTNDRPRLGIEWSYGGKLALVRPAPVEQVVASVDAMVKTFDALFSRKSDIKPQHLGGAIKIINIYYLLFKSEQGWRLVIWFSVLMNVNLALLNLLPIPVLDGGHITLALAEAAFRRPVSARVLQYIQTTCAVLLIGFMLYIAFYDVQDLREKRQSSRIIFAPKTPATSVPAQ